MNKKVKAKRRDNGEWVTGFLIDHDYIVQYVDRAESWTPNTSDHKVIVRAWDIDPSTIEAPESPSPGEGEAVDWDAVRNKLNDILYECDGTSDNGADDIIKYLYQLFPGKVTDHVQLNCMYCNAPFYGPEPKMCCSGKDCGCMGMPIDPVVCSKGCYEMLMRKGAKEYPAPPPAGDKMRELMAKFLEWFGHEYAHAQMAYWDSKWHKKIDGQNVPACVNSRHFVDSFLHEHPEALSQPPGNDEWVKDMPEKKECVFVSATWHRDYYSYEVYEIKKADGYNDKDEPAWYYGLFCGDGVEWGDIEDFVCNYHLILPTPPNK